MITLQFKHFMIESQKPHYTYSTTQANLPKKMAEEIANWGENNIPDKSLFVDNSKPGLGRETELHVTLLYGLHDTNPNGIKKFFENQKPFEIHLKNITKFKNEIFDVLKIDVESKEILEINSLLRKKFKCTIKHNIYKPHITIAYLKKDHCENLVNTNKFNGEKFLVEQVKFSSRYGKFTFIDLKNND